MVSYKLYYFNFRCRGEPTRLLFAYAGVGYEDIRVADDQWDQLKDKMPMGQLPVLEVDGKMVCQSTAIARFLAKEFKLCGKDNLENAMADMLAEGVNDIWVSIAPVYTAKMENDEKLEAEEWEKFKKSHLNAFLDRFSGFLTNNSTGWFVGDQVTWADITVAEFLSVLQECFCAEALAGHPQLKEFAAKVLSLPELKKYVENRPKCLF